MLRFFALTIFLASALIFNIQPLVGKILLPNFGGTSEVWGTCVLFFQICLLLGYTYAHLISEYLSIFRQIIIHSILMLISIMLLFSVSSLADNMLANYIVKNNTIINIPQFQILAYLTLIIAMPVVLLSASSPLLQKWYSQTNLKMANNPYRLYSVSSSANIIGLLSYVFVLEPWMGSQDQFAFWRFVYALMIMCLMGCSYITINYKNNNYYKISTTASIKKLPLGKIGYWLVLSLVPSSLLVSVTQIAAYNISSVPLIWIIPLLLYLLSFAVAFSNKISFSLNKFIYVLPFAVPVLIYYPIGSPNIFPTIILLSVFFIISLLCHYKIYRTRSHTQYLTHFYLAIGLGGILGSSFNTFMAPLIFRDYYEFPLMILIGITALIYRKKYFSLFTANKLFMWWFMVLLAMLVAPVIHTKSWVIFAICLMTIVLFYRQQFKVFFTCCLALMIYLEMAQSSAVIYQNRNFYGKQLVMNTSGFHVLLSGNTLHSQQYVDGTFALSYYKPVKELMQNNKNTLSVATIGLGAGTVVCLKKDQDNMDFYEINPDMINIAKNPYLFNYLEKCNANNIILGDGRLKLAEAPASSYDMIIFDAFTSGAIPIHLITKEAIEIYLHKLKENGSILLNISNRYIDLRSAIYASAEQLNLDMYYLKNIKSSADEHTSQWIALSEKNSDFENSVSYKNSHWQKFTSSKKIVWTDDRNTILSVIKI